MQVKTRFLSEKAFKESCKVIPGGVNSPIRNFKNVRTHPLIIQSAKDDLLFDIDQNQYIDYCMSWGALILGHLPSTVIQNLHEQLHLGMTFGASTLHELHIAQKIVELVPSVDKVRFVNSGTEATMSAIRLARGYTNKNLILKFDGHYHGHNDALLMQTGSYLSKRATSQGIPENMIQTTISLPFNDLDSLHDFFSLDVSNQLAAVILEPIAGNMGVVPVDQHFLYKLKEYSLQKNFLLIFDEVITGFRVSLQGAQSLYQIDPDLICFGKIIGGGLSAAAVGGGEKIMDFFAPNGGVFQAGTLSGNPLAMRAGLVTMQCLERDGIYEELEEKTKIITDPVEDMLKQKNIEGCIQRVGSMFCLFWGTKKVLSNKDLDGLDMDKFVRYFRFLFERGIYVPQSPFESCFVSLAHTKEHLEYTKDVILEFIAAEE